MSAAIHRRSALAALLTLLAAYLLATVALSSPASAANTVTFTVTGPGRVTTTDPNTTPKISCGDGATICSATIADDQNCPIPGICFPWAHTAAFALTANPGYSITATTGACSVANPPTSGTCTASSLSTPASFSITFADTTAPTVSLTAPAEGATLPGSASVAATAGDTSGKLANVKFFVNGALALTDTTAPYGGQVDLRSASGRATTISAQATDAAGNLSTLSSRTVSVDATAPVVAITKHPKPRVKTHKSKAKAAFTIVTEPGATLRCTVDGKAVACGPRTTVKVKKGKHLFAVTATDALGNTSAPATFTWKVKRLRR